MPVLVTGAGGFLGSHIVDLLLERGEAVRALVRSGSEAARLEGRGVEVLRGDLVDRAVQRRAVEGASLVIHSAARTGPWGDESEYEAVNVTATVSLVEAAVRADVGRFLHVSSVTVHGLDVGGDADESSPFHMEPNPYTRTKIRAEQALWRLIAERRWPITIVRPGLIYGSRDVGSFGRFAGMVSRGGMVVIGSGKNHLPLVHARDVAQGVLLAAESDRSLGQAYLLVNDEPVTQADYLDAIASELGAPRPNRHVPYRVAVLAGGLAESIYRLTGREQAPPLTRFGVRVLGGENRISIAKARAELGFSPSVSLREGVREAAAWLGKSVEVLA